MALTLGGRTPCSPLPPYLRALQGRPAAACRHPWHSGWGSPRAPHQPPWARSITQALPCSRQSSSWGACLGRSAWLGWAAEGPLPSTGRALLGTAHPAPTAQQRGPSSVSSLHQSSNCRRKPGVQATVGERLSWTPGPGGKGVAGLLPQPHPWQAQGRWLWGPRCIPDTEPLRCDRAHGSLPEPPP